MKLKSLVSEKEIKSANLTGDEDVRGLNPYAKGQKNHNQNDVLPIFDEGGQTEYCVKGDEIVINPDIY